jgi:hypothetical protein
VLVGIWQAHSHLHLEPRRRKLTFAVVTEAHLGLAEANGVFAGADTVELLELGLLDILKGRDWLATRK